MKAAQVSKAKGPFEIVEKEIPKPGVGEVRIKVEACGVCHSDSFVKEGTYPGLTFPRVPGHEVLGTIDELGAGVKGWKKGQRVGIGWHGGHCFNCDSCHAGDFTLCDNEKVCGISYDGGYAEYMVAPQEALAKVPDELKSTEAAPLLCAGITTYNALRHSSAGPGDIVAIQGVGGLGHLAIQFASKMGFRTVAISSGEQKKALALKLGAIDYIDSKKNNPAEALQKMGGARVILATAPSKNAIQSIVNGLGKNGQLLIVAVTGEAIEVNPLNLIQRRLSVKGWSSGHAKDSEETLSFSAMSKIAPMIEEFPLEKVNEAYEHMMSNKARFRVVLKMK